MSLYKQYHAEINSWDWDKIVSSAINNPQDDTNCCEDENNKIGYAFLGSLINPSGKFYLPWASSNLDSCHSCNGTGINAHKTDDCNVCNGTGKRYLKDVETYTAVHEWIKNENIIIYTDFRRLDKDFTYPLYFNCNVCNGTGKISTTCRQCGGLGSNEAYKDQEFYAALDDIARKYGGYITSGSGDPCDLFFCISIENKECEEEVLECRE